MTNSFGQLDFLELDIGQSSPRNDLPFFQKSSPKTWTTLDNHSESQIKLREKMMKPLQVNQKLKGALKTIRASLEKSKGPAFSDDQQDYNKLMNQVGEINKISKHHDDYLKEIGQLKKKDKSEKENLLEKNLSEDVYRIVKLAKEGSLTRESLNEGSLLQRNSTLQTSEFEDVAANQEKKNKKLASQISFVEDKRIAGKQLNSNAHFRHAKRKILILRAFDSTMNHKEKVKELYQNVDKQCLEKSPGNLIKSETLPLNLSTPKANRKIHHSQTDNKLNSTFQKAVDLDTYYGDSVVLVDEPHKDGKPSLRHLKTLRTIHLPDSPEDTSPKNFQLTPQTKMSTNLTKTSTEKSTTNLFSLTNTSPRNFDHQPKKCSFSERTTFKEERNSDLIKKSKPQLQLKDEDIWNPYMDIIIGDGSNSNRSNIFSRSGSQKSHYIKPDFWTPKSNKALKDELMNNLLEERVRKSTRVPIQNFKPSKPVKLPETLKHFRTSTASTSLRNLNSSRSMRDTSQNQSRKEKETSVESTLRGRGDRTIQNLIEKSYRTDSKERELNGEDMKLILNSYGFDDTIGQLRKPKSSPKKFLVLEGYQKEYLKNAIAKTDRYVSSVMKKNTNNLE